MITVRRFPRLEASRDLNAERHHPHRRRRTDRCCDAGGAGAGRRGRRGARGAAGRPRRHRRDRAGRRRRRLPLPALRGNACGGAGGRRPPGPLAMADVPACRRRAGPRLDRGNRAIHPAGLDQRQAPRRNFPLRPLALCRYPAARRLQIHRADDRRAVGRTGPADREAIITSGSAAMRRTPAAPRPDCCGSSAAPRAPCCAAGSWWPEVRLHILAKVK